MKNKVLLIRPSNIYGFNNYPSLGLISIATSLEAAGFYPVVINMGLYLSRQDAKNVILKHLPDTLLVGVTMLTSECPDAFNILSFLNGICKVPTVVGGWHPTLFPEQMERSLVVNYVVRGSGEIDIVTLARKIQNGENSPKVVPHVEPRMCELPVPSSQFNHYYYLVSPLTDIGVSGRKCLRWTPYETSRGCPSQCRFCCNVVAGKPKWQCRDAKQVVSQMRELKYTYDLNHIKVVDDNFFVNMHRVREIADTLELGQTCTWDAEGRADYVTESRLNHALLAKLKKTGLIQLTIGIESGSQHSLELMQKGITPEQAEEAVARCDEAGIYARCSFIVEVPGESREDIELTRKFVNKLRSRYKYFTCGVQTFRPYPKCELTEELVESGQLKVPQTFEEWSDTRATEIFTAAQTELPWQVAPKRSSRMAAYQSMESCVDIGYHNIVRRRDKLLCRVFIKMANIRNRLGFYVLPVDLWLYRRFVGRVK